MRSRGQPREGSGVAQRFELVRFNHRVSVDHSEGEGNGAWGGCTKLVGVI